MSSKEGSISLFEKVMANRMQATGKETTKIKIEQH